MTPEEIQKLRDWSAKKIGWERVYIDGFPMWKLPQGRVDSIYWVPDTNLNQCFMLVEKMREKGFYLHLLSDKDGYDFTCAFVSIPKDKFSLTEAFRGQDNNPALAILKAARATEE